MADHPNIAHHRSVLAHEPPREPKTRMVALTTDQAQRIRRWLEWILSKIQPLGPIVPPLFETATQLQGLIDLLPAPAPPPNDP